ncbi:hypothetical protein AYO44_10645 [Planctomycetaceae bacterium SCGC AG-212-F19]|nr:hypothetical protein AYO44_10645 [Planctomycetaceae bacterium SCGC AG-212-F19]
MVAAPSTGNRQQEAFVAKLADAALQAVAPQGVKGPSIDLEIRLWKALGKAVSQPESGPTSHEGSCEHRLAGLARTAYEAALAQGIRGSFVDIELRIWKAMRSVVRRDPILCPGPF